uniref:Methyltranfer_dom domain-containing protein n=1 Tax=Haemonchus contortus TaxID=6289 RepID=A0A7I4YZP4_HAECO|nr:protein RRNAD1-like [Haemonchus contortus]
MDTLFQHVFGRYAWLMDCFMTDYFISDHWNRLPSSWQSAFKDAEPEDLVCLVTVSHYPSKVVLPLSILCLKSIISRLPSRSAVRSSSDIAKACGMRSKHALVPSDRASIGIAANNILRTKMKLKKQYEIDCVVRMATILRENEAGPFFNTLIDIGAGMGHLSRVLSIAFPDCPVVAVEQDKELVQRSIELDHTVPKFHKNFIPPRHHCESVQSGFYGSCLDELSDGQKALLIGLHPCGDLSASILRIFVESTRVTSMILSGCCYHKLTLASERRDNEVLPSKMGFPLSSKYSFLRISYAARDLACHANECFAEKLLTKPKYGFRTQCYRAVIEWLFANHDDPGIRQLRGTLPLCSVLVTEKTSFEEIVRQALAKYPSIAEAILEQIKNDERARKLIETAKEEWRQYLVVHCLRLLFGPLVEYLLITDRIEFLREHGHEAVVVPLFDPTVSPRNFAIVATKTRSSSR